jgi:hypothetical protein
MPESLVTLLVIKRRMVNPHATLQTSGDDPVTAPGYNGYFTPAGCREVVVEAVVMLKNDVESDPKFFWGRLTRSWAVPANSS